MFSIVRLFNIFSYTTLINLYGHHGHYQVSLELLERMTKEKVLLIILTRNIVINFHARGGLDWEGLLGLFKETRHEGIQPDIVTYNTLLSVCAGRGLEHKAEMVFRTMNKGGILPDINTYSYLVDIFRKLNRLEKFSGLLKEIESGGNLPDISSYNVLMHAVGCVPNAATYSMLLNLYERYDDVWELFLEMKVSNTNPNDVIYNILVQVFGEVGYFKEVVTLFHDMLLKPIDRLHYIRRMIFMLNITNEMGSMPIVETYNSLIYMFTRGGLYEELEVVLTKMSEFWIIRDKASFNGMIKGYRQVGNFKEAIKAYVEMEKARLMSVPLNLFKCLLYCKSWLINSNDQLILGPKFMIFKYPSFSFPNIRCKISFLLDRNTTTFNISTIIFTTK
ncbi:hypothetical protein K2173_000617 [Erythroxylum novogranatense]|uniref:Pentatricopeptide repeat-containing protein n=1 Tax=Erythroxylum novogranatense TaxID=1862640 RepID=A0AAV8S7S7_9ROSI|nr:hypothetical protein K2173_000617 [Erythroxylum novogranatense]